MSNIRVNTTELLQLLEMIPTSHNLMLVGRHGIGKSETLSEFFFRKGMHVVPLFPRSDGRSGRPHRHPEQERADRQDGIHAAGRDFDGLFILTDGEAPEPKIPVRLRTKILWVCESDAAYCQNAKWMQNSGRVCTMRLR